MFTMDHFEGSMEGFETTLTKSDAGIWTAEGLGLKASHADQGQAMNDLNAKIYDAISKGELTPDMGN